MGIPADEDQPPYKYGADCNLLTPDLWVSGENPKYITAVFTGIDVCPDWEHLLMNPIPNGQAIVCEQTDGDACWWIGHSTTWDVWFQGNSFATGNSGLYLFDNTWILGAFWGHGPNQTATSWNNLLTCIGGFIGENGSGRIY